MEPNVQPNAPTPTEAPAAPQPPTFTPGIANDVVLTPQPTEAPVEPAAPVAGEPTPQPQPQGTPQEPAQPVAPAQAPVEQPKPQTYEEYIAGIVGKQDPVDLPKPSAVTDPAELDKFFEDYGHSIREQVMQEVRKANTVQSYERNEWDKVFAKYPEVKDDQAIRDTIHNMRLGAFNRGEGMTPIQAADFLVGALHNQYKKGVNDTNVQTAVVDSQPLNGSGAPAPDPGVNYGALQDGGREAAVGQLEALIAAGKI